MSDSAASIAWLRERIEGDKALAVLARCQGDGVWAVAHRGCDEDCTEPCAKAGQCHSEPCWHTRVEGDSITVYDEGGHDEDQAAHIARHDPQGTIADCEAKLAILALHADTAQIVKRAEESIRQAMAPPVGSVANRDYLDGGRELAVLELAIRHLAAGYQHRDGYAEHWGGA